MDHTGMNLAVRLREELDKPLSILEREQFQKVMLDCVEPGIGYSVFFLIGSVALYGHVPTVLLVVGGLMMLAEAVIKIGLVKKFEKQNVEERANPHWRRIIWSGGVYTGVFFGLASLVLLLPLPQTNLTVLAFAYLGVYITSCWLGSSYLPTAVCKLIPLTLPLTIAILWVGEPLSMLVSLSLVFMTGMSLFYIRSMVRQHADLIDARLNIEEISENLKLEKQAAEKLVVDKSRFIASASHDLRQPLHALGLFHSAIRSRSKDEKVHTVMDSVDKSTVALNHLFEGLLDVSRLDSGAIEPVLEHFRLDSLFSSIYDEFQQMAQTKGLVLEVNCGNCVVYSDILLLEQVLRNLLGNAIKFTESGAITLSASVNEDKVIVSVVDTGPGIAEKDLDNIFDEFHQTERSKYHEERGFGLGLAIVRRITRLLDMPLSLSSVHPSGACFSLEAPVGVEEKTRMLSGPQHIGDIKLNARVLVIDDNVSILDGMQTLLFDWNIACLTAGSLEEAIQCLMETGFMPELIICDYHLSLGENGIDAARELCNHVGHDIPIIVITGDTTVDVDSFTATRGVDILYKPVRPGELRESIQRNLECSSRGEILSATAS